MQMLVSAAPQCKGENRERKKEREKEEIEGETVRYTLICMLRLRQLLAN